MMSYMALARKWRPRTFSQLLGQEHVNKALINALQQQRLHHAYLFTGTRGVGKTSVARILAKALNCEQGISAKPCLNCDACLAIEQGRFVDLIEIDGASKTRVEDTRDLLDNVPYAPTAGRFKIYLIDEVHMLSTHSFNALLKTLEEPPAHVKFILATTDPQKLPVTVLSRCLQFHLRQVTPELIAEHLKTVLDDEQLSYEATALTILAQAAKGSMRDALSLLDQAINSSGSTLETSTIKSLLGHTQHDYALTLLHALAEQNATNLLTLSQQIGMEGGNFTYVLDQVLDYLHQMGIYHQLGGSNPLINPAAELQALAGHLSPEDIQLFYQIALKGRDELALAPTALIGFNMTLLRMLTFRPAPRATVPTLAHETTTQPTSLPMPTRKELSRTDSTQQGTSSEELPKKIHETVSPSPLAPAAPTTSTKETDNWMHVISHLSLTGLALNAVENAELINKDGRTIHLRVAKGHQSLFTPTVLTRVEKALSDYYQETIKIALKSEDATLASPAQQKDKALQQKQHSAETALQQDPILQQLQTEFNADLVKNSIVPI